MEELSEFFFLDFKEEVLENDKVYEVFFDLYDDVFCGYFVLIVENFEGDLNVVRKNKKFL